MFRSTTFDAFKEASLHQKRAVVFQEFPCDDITPIHAFMALNASHGAVLLESAVNDPELGRYSLLAIEPFAQFTVKGSSSTFSSSSGDCVQEGTPFDFLRQRIAELRLPTNAALPPLVGGAIGFAAYDAIRLIEAIPDRHDDKYQLPDLFFLFHAIHIAFDHFKGSVLISVNCALSGDAEADYAGAVDKIKAIRSTLKEPVEHRAVVSQGHCSFSDEMTDDVFCEKILKAKEYIRNGDAFQIVLSRAFQAEFHAQPFDVYRALRMTNPSPFMFFLQTKEFAIAGSSPERLVKLEKGKLHMVPIAGTRPRVVGEEDATVVELLQNPKEDAEHMMLVDLGRNDLGIISKVGSVQVKELKKVRYFPHVIHLVSQLESQIADGLDAIDALRATFPAGTLTGAPKIRAMQIIDELEVSRRGLYGGAICTIDNDGHLDSCIAIRTAFFQDGHVVVRAGAGIVFDSDPQQEADETRAKAKGVIAAVKLAMEGVL